VLLATLVTAAVPVHARGHEEAGGGAPARGSARTGEDGVAELPPSEVRGTPGNTIPRETGRIAVTNVGEFTFEPAEVETVRPDLFEAGHFSIFDILVHLDRRGDIDLRYYFDRDADTHVIDSIDGRENWWYTAYYDGGWPERNVFRMDYFPYKDRMTIRIEPERPERLASIREVHRREFARYLRAGSAVTVDTVSIQGPSSVVEFSNVEVRPHDLRSDMLEEGTVTAIDVLMSLADEGKLSHRIEWVDTIGFASVQNYFVERINDDARRGRCGFVYEVGPDEYRGFRGNHIHLPSDARIIRAPEYVQYYWICV
jgi:hypothetical protein